MFISALELFKIGIGPSSSHTMGPMIAARDFIALIQNYISSNPNVKNLNILCTLKGSLAFTGKGHATDRAVALGLHNFTPEDIAEHNLDTVLKNIWGTSSIQLNENCSAAFSPSQDIIFDKSETLKEHPNGLVFALIDGSGTSLLTQTYFSIGGGFISTLEDINEVVAPLKMESASSPYPFDSAQSMLEMSTEHNLSIAQMKRINEQQYLSEEVLEQGLDAIRQKMQQCIENGLSCEGTLPGGLNISRRAKNLYQQLIDHPDNTNVIDWLCAYAMAVNEENAAGHMVVTAPTNGAAGVIPAVLHYFITHEKGTPQQVRDFLLTASAIGGIIKHRSSISGAEVGCQGEVGSAASMAAAGLCAARGGSSEQIENAAEIALEHHLGMTCDPVNGLVQVPCIERNGFGAIKAYTATSLAMRGNGQHFMPLDNCIAAMRQTGLEMSHKYKETSLGGLAVSFTEC